MIWAAGWDHSPRHPNIPEGRFGGLRAMLPPRYWFVVGVIVLSGCGGKSKIVTLPAPTPARVGNAEEGVASWYGHPYHGRRTSNGEIGRASCRERV